MSYIYNKEPPTHGKVLVKTTLGDLDIELWSKEAPLACRNFVQLCMEGYYNEIIFHRIVQDFITQGGDPTGTGEVERAIGHTFKDEFHTRLKFVRRGLVGCASSGANDNGSQFFITLGRADELTKKHTLFGKVTGDTLYNLVQFNEIPTDKEDRPLNPVPHITRTEVLQNPFDDIVPRGGSGGSLERKTEDIKSQSRATKNFSLLSFGEEAEEEEEEANQSSKELKIRSSHDVLKEDTRLSSQPAVDPAVSSLGDGSKEEGMVS
ncbi:Spliceosome-associated protein CWC27 homolog [Geodia barretti]|uniref:Peptidyl-prolyl cis-trans isomerase n=1 Tax=Geodia barretti TaxID=519541 RepID=A0AA35RLW7_GEOBA|nr:Spliceosome-associated protein CWC27 homolog [Geodia barretti]